MDDGVPLDAIGPGLGRHRRELDLVLVEPGLDCRWNKEKQNYPSQGPQQTLFFQLALIQNLFPEIGDGNDSSDGVGADDDCDDGW